MKPLLRPLFLCAALVATLCTASAETITLKQQWQLGKRYVQSMQMDSDTTITIGDQKMAQKTAMTVQTSSTVAKAKEGAKKIVAMKYDRMVMDVDMNGQKTTMDSAQPAKEGAPGNPMQGMIGKEIRLVLDANDKFLDVENLDALAAAAGGAANPMVASMLSKESLGRTIQQGSLQALPEHPVKPGDSWPFSVEIPLQQMGNGLVQGTYTYLGMEQHNGVACAKIGMEGKLNMDLSAAGGGAENPLAQLGLKVKDGTMKGMIWFDNALGMARDFESLQEMSMAMNNPIKPGEVMTLPLKQTVRATLTKVEDVK